MGRQVNKLISTLIVLAFIPTSTNLNYISSYISSDKDALRSMSANKIVTSDLQQSLLAAPPKQELLDIPKASEYLLDKTSSAGDVTVSEVRELINSFVPIDPIIFESVDTVEVVETIAMPDKLAATMKKFEYNLDLLHPASVAAAEEIKWANDTKSKVSKEFADAAAARWTRNYYNIMPWLNGKVVIGEGERDEAAMLYIGEEVGAGQHGGPGTVGVDIAGDVLELTNGINTAAVKGSVSTAAYAETGGIRSAPDIYLTYWKIGPQAKGAEINVTLSPEQNLKNIAKASGKDVGQLRGAMLLRERHINRLLDLVDAGVTVGKQDKLLNDLINSGRAYRYYIKDNPEDSKAALELLEEVKAAYQPLDKEVKRVGAYKSGNIYLLADGDLMPVFGLQKGKLDFMTGAGGAPEGELSASALIAMGGAMSARYCSYTALKETKWGADLDRDWNKFSEKEQKRLKSFGFASPDSPEEGKASWGKVWTAEELVTGKEVVFIASAVKNSPWLDNLKAPVLDEDTGILYVYTIRSTKSGDTRIWKIGYQTPIPRLKAAIEAETDPVDRAELSYKLAQVYGRLALRDKALDILRGLTDITGVTTSIQAKYYAAYMYYKGMYYLLDVNNKEDLALSFFEDAYAEYHIDEMRARDRIFMISQFKGDALAKQKEHNKALYYYSKALAVHPEDAQLIAKIAKAKDSTRAVKSSSAGDISKVEAAIQITPETEVGDLAFTWRVVKEAPTVLINHSEYKDYLGGTTERSNEQLKAFLKAGYNAIVAFGDFPMRYKGKDYLAARIRKFPNTLEGIEAMRSDTKAEKLDHLSQPWELYNEVSYVTNLSEEVLVNMYSTIPLVIELDSGSMNLWQALDKGLIGLDQAKREVVKELSTEAEILYEIDVLFEGIDKKYLDQMLLPYEPVQAIREAAIPIELAEYRRGYIQEAIADKLGVRDDEV
ncbi:MAG: fructose-bisphosphatase class II, partial [Candidatus Orphnella occulta]|nr:fructose-bisphosphatase class II [Candidatus Orphnella occulta]